MAKRRRIPKLQYDLDIVIPVYGRPDLLQECLASIDTDGFNAQIILVDDLGPKQEELNEIYQSLNGTSHLIRHKENQGFSRTVNDGIKAGSAPLVLQINTDVMLQPGAIRAMIVAMTDEVGIVGPKLLFPPDSQDPVRPAGKIQQAGLGFDFRGRVVHLNISWSPDNPRVNERREVQAIGGACMLIKRQTLKDIMDFYRKGGDPTSGPFNEVYGRGTYEDVEICLIARETGWKVVYTPDAVGYHYVSASGLQDGGFPINRNEHIFKARCGSVVAWDDWKYG